MVKFVKICEDCRLPKFQKWSG